MVRENVSDLAAFLAVARTGSFTRAAKQLGVSQPALSHALKGLENRLGLRLLNRTTRRVSTTEAGERLLRSIAPHFDGIEAGLAALTELREKPAGTVRITTGDHQAETILLCAPGRDRRAGHGGGADRAGHAHGRGWFIGLLCEQAPAPDATRLGRPHLHQSPVPNAWRGIRVGVREGWPRGQRPRRGAVDRQRHRAGTPGRAWRRGPRLPARRLRAALHRVRHPCARTGGLVRAVSGLPPLLPEPAPAIGGVHGPG